jgi:hypothetical protein
MASPIRALMRSRKASPTSRFFPETRNDMAASAQSVRKERSGEQSKTAFERRRTGSTTPRLAARRARQ